MNGIVLAASLTALSLAGPALAQVTESDWSPGGSGVDQPEIIPPGFRGRWAPNAGACSDADGVDRLYVGASGIDSYESGGRLERITQTGQSRSVKLKLSYEGEGNFWDSIQTWTLGENGDRLTIAEDGRGTSELLIRCD
jgi:hypothetical protein